MKSDEDRRVAYALFKYSWVRRDAMGRLAKVG